MSDPGRPPSVRAAATVDLLDNLVMGSTPDFEGGFVRADVPLVFFSDGQRSPSAGQFGLQDAIRLKVASATDKADKKRQAAEMEMQAIVLERNKKRKAEELEDHARIEELKRRVLFGDDSAPAAQQRETHVDLNPEEAQAPRRFFGWF